MKKLLLSLCFLAFMYANSFAQCASSASTYDLTVTGNIVLGPTSSSFFMGIICAGGRLMDSANCCTRMVHIEAGGIYEAGPAAYAFVYIKNGGTFDAHGNNSFFGVYYEAGATILNYSGPMTLCPVVTFPPGACTPTGIIENNSTVYTSVYPNPCNDVLHLENNFSKDAAITIYDITGKIVMEYYIIINNISVSDLSEGMYTFAIEVDGNKVSYGKFAIVR